MDAQHAYPIHPLVRLFPPLTPAQYDALVASIAALGLMDPITVWRGQIIDGLHRLRACAEAGVEPRYQFLDDDADPVQYVLDRHLARRHLDESGRAVVAYRLSEGSKPGRPRGDDENYANLRSFKRREAARLMGVSPRLANLAGQVLSPQGRAIPELRLAMEQGRVRVSDAARATDLPSDVQEKVLDLVTRGDAKTLARAVKQVQSQSPSEPPATQLLSRQDRSPGLAPVLYAARVAGLAGTVVPADSVDAVITYPPHRDGELALLPDLAAFAVHALRPPACWWL